MPPSDDLVAVAWADTRLRYRVPGRYVEQLLDGVAADLHKDRYATFAELAAYSYGVASTVGLMSMAGAAYILAVKLFAVLPAPLRSWYAMMDHAKHEREAERKPDA